FFFQAEDGIRDDLVTGVQTRALPISALLYDSLKAGGRTSEAAKQNGRYAAIQQASQGIASVVGAALATIDMTLCFTICGLGGLRSEERRVGEAWGARGAASDCRAGVV